MPISPVPPPPPEPEPELELEQPPPPPATTPPPPAREVRAGRPSAAGRPSLLGLGGGRPSLLAMPVGNSRLSMGFALGAPPGFDAAAEEAAASPPPSTPPPPPAEEENQPPPPAATTPSAEENQLARSTKATLQAARARLANRASLGGSELKKGTELAVACRPRTRAAALKASAKMTPTLEGTPPPPPARDQCDLLNLEMSTDVALDELDD